MEVGGPREIKKKLTDYSTQCASLPSRINVKDLSWFYQLFENIERRFLMPLPCNSCDLPLLSINIDVCDEGPWPLQSRGATTYNNDPAVAK